MTDNVTLPGTGENIATDDVGGVQFQRVKLDIGGDGASVPVTGALPVSGPLTDTQLRATAVPVSDGGGSITVDGAVAVSGSVAVTGPLTDAQIRATALPISGTVTATGPLTDTQLRATAVTVSGPLTDAQLRATPVPVSGSFSVTGGLTDSELRATPVAVSGPLTDAELRAAALSIVEPALILTGAAAQTATVANILEAAASATPTNVENYRSASVQVVSTGTGGTFIFEQSNDGTNWSALPVFNAALTNGAAIVGAITATATAIVYTVPLRCRFFRLRIATTITGGAIQAFTRLSTEPWTPSVTRIASNNATDVLTNAQLLAGTNLAGDVGFQVRANNTGAAGVAAVMSAATPVATSIKASNGRVVGIFLQNSAAALRSFKMFNQTGVTLGTTAATFEIDIPAGQAVHITVPVGLAFSAGIQWAVTGAKGLTDNTGSLAVNDVSGFIAWA